VNAAALGVRRADTVALTLLGNDRARLAKGAHSATALDADLCAKNGRCAASEAGTIVSTTPTAVAVQLADGDVVSFLGDTAALAAGAGSAVTVRLDSTSQTALSDGARTATMTRAAACATINAGCSPLWGVVTASSGSTSTIALSDGGTLQLSAPNALSVNAVAVVQPLDGRRVIVRSGSSVNEAVTVAFAGR
jgi:hypothetical protein